MNLSSPKRFQIVGYSLAVVGVGLISAASILHSSSRRHPAAGVWWDLLIAGLVALTLSIVATVLALRDRVSLLFGIPFGAGVALVVAGAYFDEPGWVVSVASAMMLVGLGGLLFTERGLLTLRRLHSRERPADRADARLSGRQRLSGLLFQAFFAVIFAGLVVAQFEPVSFDPVLTAALVILLFSLLLRLRSEPRSLLQGAVSTLFVVVVIVAMHVTVPNAVWDAIAALSVVWIAVMLLGTDVRNLAARRRRRS